MWIRSRDIRDQSRKLSEIAQKFGRFLALLNLWGRAFQNLYPVQISARRLKKFDEYTPISPKVIEPNTLNFRPNFKFLRLNCFGGTLDPLMGVR